ncbi:MAG: hypothetical protein M3Z04_12860 [Chloroflexota bacterium]|nr:hypothetical protein [Chloroflexota bacterium]
MRDLLKVVSRGALLLLLVPVLLIAFGVGPVYAQVFTPARANDWQVGNTVYLSRGTQIWVAPDLANSCYHTVVPVDNWEVKVTGGPRGNDKDRRTWYDTSRRAAGDPSGGTGWVNIEQVDQRPGVQDAGRYCPPGGSTTVSPTSTPTRIVDSRWPPQIVIDIIQRWQAAPLLLKIGILALALLLLSQTPRLRVFGSAALLGFARAILWGIILGGATDLLRPLWEVPWLNLPAGYRAFDPALVALVLPLLWWGFGYLLAVAGIGIMLIALVVGVLGVLIYLAYVLELLRSF